jgi:hypothetical protein
MIQHSSGTGYESTGARRKKTPMAAFGRSMLWRNESPGSSMPVHTELDKTSSFCSMEHDASFCSNSVNHLSCALFIVIYHSGKPLGAWLLTRYTGLAACSLLSCCDLGLSCLGCLFVLGSCLADIPFWPPPLVCLPIQVLGGNGGGTPFTGCCCMNPAFWTGRCCGNPAF